MQEKQNRLATCLTTRPGLLFGTAVAILTFVLYGWPLSHVLPYIEQHRLFIYSSGYIAEELHHSSLQELMLTFMVQFAYYPVLGAAVMALLVAALYSLICGTLTRLTGRGMLSALLAAPVPLGIVAWCATFEHLPLPLMTGLLVAGGIWIVVALINLKWRPARRPITRRGWIIGSVLMALMLGGTVYSALKVYLEPMERQAVLVEQAYAKGDYQECLRRAERYLAEGSRMHIVAYYRALSLARLRQLPERILEYPPLFGAETLYMIWDGYVLKREYGFNFYELIGGVNMAQRWQFEAMTNYGETGPTLARFAAYNIINGRDRMAAKNIRKLKRTLFYRDVADSLEQRLGTGEVPGIRNLYAQLPDSVGNFAFFDPMEELGYINTYVPGDEINQHLFLVGSLLDNDVQRFMTGLNTFGMHDVSKLPPMYRQAVAMWIAEDKNGWWRDAGFTYPREECERYMQFTQAYAQRNRFKMASDFSGTYWYYFTNQSRKRPGARQTATRKANIPHS